LNFRSENPDPYVSGKYLQSAKNFKMAAVLFLIFTISILIDEYSVEKLENETIISLSERSEHVPAKGTKAQTFLHVDLKTESYAITVDPYVLLVLDLKPGDKLDFWRTKFYHQRKKLAANNKGFLYKTAIDEKWFLVLIQGLFALIGLVSLVPGNIRFTLIFISGVLSLYSFLVIL
jgi:hypothetical protein